jgi:uncharacterized protein
MNAFSISVPQATLEDLRAITLIINKGRLDLFNTTNFSPNVIFPSKPSNIVGIESARAYYANYLTGFSNIKFEIADVFEFH